MKWIKKKRFCWICWNSSTWFHQVKFIWLTNWVIFIVLNYFFQGLTKIRVTMLHRLAEIMYVRHEEMCLPNAAFVNSRLHESHLKVWFINSQLISSLLYNFPYFLITEGSCDDERSLHDLVVVSRHEGSPSKRFNSSITRRIIPQQYQFRTCWLESWVG